MRLRLELGKEDLKAGVNKPADKLTIHDFRVEKLLFEKAEYIIYKGPRGKKRVLKEHGKTSMHFIGIL